MTEHLKGDIRLHVGTQSVHVHKDLLPLVVVSGGSGAGILAAGAGHRVAAGAAVADGTGLAVRPDTFSGSGQNFRIGHGDLPPYYLSNMIIMLI